jgi:hypothetical protein
MSGRIQLVGVYQLPVTEDLVVAQAQELYGDEPSSAELAQVRKQLQSTVLIETLITDADDTFDVSDFAQEIPGLPSEEWQVAWAEAFLSADGTELLVERGEDLPTASSTFRVAFFIHAWQAGQPLLSSYGPLPGPKPTPMPDRLARLAPFELP